MKKLLCFLLLVACVVGITCYAEDAEDSESSLRELLTMETKSDHIAVFEYGDYDGDGICEAFALLSDSGWSGDGDGITGELWFVSPRECTKIREQDSYLTLSKQGVGPMLFTAEVWYGGSGSSSVVWGVSQSSKAEVLGKEFEGISGGDVPNEFYMYPSAFDMSPDGTGHTWKRYYFYLDGFELKEYGGLWISRNQLEEVEGGEAILQSAEAEGWTIGDIYYRANGVINVNLRNDWSNDNLTLRFDGKTVVDTGERYGGVYSAASGIMSDVYYPESFEHEISINSQAGRAVVDSNISRETIAAGTREQILQARGIFNTGALINVTGVDFSEEGENQKLRVYFKDEVYVGGSEGYWADWLTANGSVSEAYADLDGDGADEYILIYLVSEQITEYDYTYWSNTWNIVIYEPEGNTLRLACEFPFAFSWWGERFVKLLQTESGMRIMVADINYWDGGGGGISTTLYGYDGEKAYVDMIMNATVGEDSYIAYGPFDIDKDENIIEALHTGSYDQSALSSVNLIEGQNCEVFWSSYDENGSVFLWNEQSDGNNLNPKAFTGFDKITQAAKRYGVVAGYSIEQHNEDGYLYEYYSLRLLGGETTLLWASEGWDDYSNQSYIDITVHYIDHPIINFVFSDDYTASASSEQSKILEESKTGINTIEEDEELNSTSGDEVNDSRPGFVIDGASDWNSAYEQCVIGNANASLLSLCDNWGDLDEPEYGIHDMDGDGVPELIAYNGGCMAEWENYVFTFNAGRIVYLGDAGHRWMYYFDSDKYHGLFCEDGAQGYFMLDYYYLQDGVVCHEEVKEVFDNDEYTENIITENIDLLELSEDVDNILWLETMTSDSISQIGWDMYVEGQLSI